MRKSSIIALGLTGRSRYGHTRFIVGPTILVLQVEEEVADQHGDGDHGPVTRAWRDARVEGMAELELPASA
jgi:hypothetical protein